MDESIKVKKTNSNIKNFFKTLAKPFQALVADDISEEKELKEELKKIEAVQQELHKGKEEDYISNLKVEKTTGKTKGQSVKHKESKEKQQEMEIGD